MERVPPPSARSTVLSQLALGAVWGASFLFLEWGVPEWGTLRMIALRLGLAVVCLVILGGLLGWLRWPGLSKMPLIAQIGLLNSALPFLLFAWASTELTAGLLAIINATAPIFGAVFQALREGRPPSLSIRVGLLLGLGGVVVTAWPSVGGGTADLAWAVLALLAALLASASYGAASVLSRGLGGIPPFQVTLWSMAWALVMVLPLALAAMWMSPLAAAPSGLAWLAALGIGVLCTGLAYIEYFRLIDRVGPAVALSVAFLIPIFGSFWGAVFLGEPVGWTTLAGAILVLLGMSLTTGLLTIQKPLS